jgi:hypothetical protein
MPNILQGIPEQPPPARQGFFWLKGEKNNWRLPEMVFSPDFCVMRK